MTASTRTAILKADEIRDQYGLDMFEPANPIDICLDLGIQVRLVNINMEGMYFVGESGSNPAILLSNLRPFPRRFYTCGHELGHHVFGHGTKIDELKNSSYNSSSDADELLVDSFAGALLMPVSGVQAEFASRDLKPSNATPIEFITVASQFGVGYGTLITHCKTNNIISNAKAVQLSKVAPAAILKSLSSAFTTASSFKLIDGLTQLSTVDLEVGNLIFLPDDVQVEGAQLEYILSSEAGVCYRAICPGIGRVCSKQTGFSAFVRVQSFQFNGLAEFRHLEDK